MVVLEMGDMAIALAVMGLGVETEEAVVGDPRHISKVVPGAHFPTVL